MRFAFFIAIALGACAKSVPSPVDAGIDACLGSCTGCCEASGACNLDPALCKWPSGFCSTCGVGEGCSRQFGCIPASTSAPLDSPATVSGFLRDSSIAFLSGGVGDPPLPGGLRGHDRDLDERQCLNRLAYFGNAFGLSLREVGARWVADGGVGSCQVSAVNGERPVVLLGVPSITNVRGNAACFDIDLSLGAGGGPFLEGRGRVSLDRSLLELELFYVGEATGHRCVNGDVGSAGVSVGGRPFTLDAVQRLRSTPL